MKYPIRILHEGMTYNCGGVETFVMNLYRNIDRDKFQFDFVNVEDCQIAFSDEIEALGGRIYKVPRASLNGRLEQIQRIKRLFVSSDFQVLHSHIQSLHKNLYWKYASKFGLPVVVHYHSAHPSEPVRSLKEALYQFIIERRNRTYRKYADAFFACSELASERNCNGKATVFKNSIDVDNFRYDANVRESVRMELGLDDSFTVISVGRISEEKNPFFLLDVFKSIRNKKPNSKLIIAGDGPLRDEVTKRINDLGLENDVFLLGIRHDVGRLLQGADAFLFPSQFEGFGIALLEAQASGLPCFTSKDVVPEEVNTTGLVRFLSLGKAPEYWADAVLASQGEPRKDYGDVLKTQGYDGKNNVKIMENKYLELARLKK